MTTSGRNLGRELHGDWGRPGVGVLSDEPWTASAVSSGMLPA